MTTAGDRRTIAVGYDGSSGAQAALRWALSSASGLHARVVAIHAVGLLEHAAGTPETLTAQLWSVVDDAGAGRDDVELVFVDGNPTMALLRAIEPPIDGNLLVVGSRGHHAHAGQLLGSTSHTLAEEATVPVVIVPPPDQT